LGKGFWASASARPTTTARSACARTYLLPFEIVSIHLLVVLIGAAYLARAKRRRVILVTPAPAATDAARGAEEAS